MSVDRNVRPESVPASLLPHGGFGDPDVPNSVWRAPKGFDPDKLMQAKFQHRFAIAVRICMDRAGISEGELAQELGYRSRGWLGRKLNGNETLTLRDVARIEAYFGSQVLRLMSE